MFLDKVKIWIKAGNGGNGAVSFLRTKLTANGGPDGGDGGKGGNIVFVACDNVSTLYSFQFKKKFTASDGLKGEKKNKKGADGSDTLIEVPCGTVIKDAESGKVIADLTEKGQTFIALRGGYGGKGNAFYATPTRQAPHFSKSGEVTKERQVLLELQTIADVGLVGYPNVGKSTLLSVISNAQPKIANYAFTTLTPNLGVVKYYENNFIVADIPGLIEGASEGVGLGHDFLRHVSRVRLILHMVDISESEERNAVIDYEKINLELKKYSSVLASLPQIVVLTKCDLLSENELAEKIKSFKEKTKQKEVIPISSITHSNIDELISKMWAQLSVLPKKEPTTIEETNFDKRDKTSIEVRKNPDGSYEAFGGYIEELARGVVLSDAVSFAFFDKKLKESGVIDRLKEIGLRDGDTVKVKDAVFEYYD